MEKLADWLDHRLHKIFDWIERYLILPNFLLLLGIIGVVGGLICSSWGVYLAIFDRSHTDIWEIAYVLFVGFLAGAIFSIMAACVAIIIAIVASFPIILGMMALTHTIRATTKKYKAPR